MEDLPGVAENKTNQGCPTTLRQNGKQHPLGCHAHAAPLIRSMGSSTRGEWKHTIYIPHTTYRSTGGRTIQEKPNEQLKLIGTKQRPPGGTKEVRVIRTLGPKNFVIDTTQRTTHLENNPYCCGETNGSTN